ncbi:MAG: N-acetyltransferase [Paraglaciecola sp.]|uniref:GNAT family N-acetyltransferase n=1 Tax=Paraglaciecola sp. TaxID=1920173 RepID=UPI0032975F42
MSIRKYSQSDYNQLLEIYSTSKLDELKYENTNFELLPLDKDEIRLAQIYESDIYVYGTKYVVGFCAYSGSEIRALFVHPNYRGKGIGVSLLEFMLSNIIGTATLYVAASNHPAIKLYQKYGFKIISEFKTTYNRKAVLANKMEQLPVYG